MRASPCKSRPWTMPSCVVISALATTAQQGVRQAQRTQSGEQAHVSGDVRMPPLAHRTQSSPPEEAPPRPDHMHNAAAAWMASAEPPTPLSVSITRVACGACTIWRAECAPGPQTSPQRLGHVAPGACSKVQRKCLAPVREGMRKRRMPQTDRETARGTCYGGPALTEDTSPSHSTRSPYVPHLSVSTYAVRRRPRPRDAPWGGCRFFREKKHHTWFLMDSDDWYDSEAVVEVADAGEDAYVWAGGGGGA
jgi:hypothetical protein